MRAVTADLAADEDQLYRQALELGLDDDVVIRRLLREKMRLLLRREPRAEPPADAELAACLERHRDRFVREATASFTQVFVSAAVHGDGLGERAAAVADEIRARALGPDEAAELADAFPLAARWNGRTRGEIARRFGDGFAAEVLALEPGAWSPPIASPYGLHLVWVHDRSPGGLPSLSEVRGQVALILAEERAAARLNEGMRRLRELYEVRVEGPETAISEARR